MGYRGADLQWETSDGIAIKAKDWGAAGEPKAVVLIVHGLGSHKERFAHVCKALYKDCLAPVIMDRRGHGASGGKRGHQPSFESYMADLDQFIEEGTKRYEEFPVFLYGHSQGGNLVLNYMLRRQPKVQGAIITSPWIRLVSPPKKVVMALGKGMKAVKPDFTKTKWLDTSLLSRDPDVGKRYETDPLVHFDITLETFYDCYEAGLWSLDNADKLHRPTLLMHGSEDKVTDPKASKEFAKKAGDVCDLKMWKGGYHELHNDLEKKKVIRHIIKWTNEHLFDR